MVKELVKKQVFLILEIFPKILNAFKILANLIYKIFNSDFHFKLTKKTLKLFIAF